MTDLDDLEGIARLDTLGVLDAMEGFDEQLRAGWELGLAAAELPSGEGLESVVVLGMGGSGSAGDIARTVAEPRLPLPFLVEKGYGELPAWVGRNSLVFAVSYSGNTEETLSAVTEAHARGARLVTVSSGGRLQEIAADFGAAHVSVPGGRQPRASLGFLAMPILAILSRLEVVPDLAEDAAETFEVAAAEAHACDRDVPLQENPAKALGAALAGGVPVVWGGRGVGAAAAYRFKCDLNEYGKLQAYWNELPEANHNEIVGFDSDLLGGLYLVMLRDRDEHPRIARRFEVTEEAIRTRLAGSSSWWSEGESRLARILSLVARTQFAAIYAGLASGVDPGPVDSIESMKEALGPYEVTNGAEGDPV